MTFQHTILYNNKLNFSLDNTKVNMTTSGTILALESENEDYIQTFDTSTGFSITASLMEFSGSRLQQKDQRPSDAIFYHDFEQNDAAWNKGGTNTTLLVDGATISGGKLNIPTGGLAAYAKLDAGVVQINQVGTIRFPFTPDFTAPLVHEYNLCALDNFVNNNNLIYLSQRLDRSLIMGAYDSSGVFKIAEIAFGQPPAWTPGQTYILEFRLNFNTGVHSAYIDGSLVGTISNVNYAFTRSDTVTYLCIGSRYIRNGAQSSTYDYFSVYNDDAPSSYALPTLIYAETRSVAPKFQHGVLGTIIAANSFTTVESGGCGFSINVLPGTGTYGYFDGMDWVDSNGTYAQSTTQPVFDANLIDESVYGANSAQFAIHMPAGNTQHWIDTMTLNVLEQIGYFTTNPFIIELTEFVADQILSVSEVSTITGSDDIRNVLNIDGVNYWIDTGDSSLKVSTGYLESNTIAEINSNVALINVLIALGASIKLGKYLHSDDGTTTPTLISNIINYSFFGGSPASLPLCTVWGYTRDSAGVIAPNITVKATLKKAVEIGDSVILKGDSSVTSDANGYFEMDLPQTVSYLFSFINSSNAVLYKETASIPVATDKNYDDL